MLNSYGEPRRGLILPVHLWLCALGRRVVCRGVRGIVSVEIRPEQAGDEAAIYKVTADAFRGRPYADGDEQDLLNRLRELGQLALSLVATDGDQLVGQITFSPSR